MKYLKYFEEASAYEAWKNSEDYVLPNVSFVEETKNVKFNCDNMLTVCYDIQDITSPSVLCSSFIPMANTIAKMYVDGIKLDAIVSTYQFNTTGDHIVKYEFVNPNTIGAGAPVFMESSPIKYIVIPSYYTRIESNAFNMSGLYGDIVIPDSITYIGTAAFHRTNITSIRLSNNMTEILGGIIGECPITSITIPESVTMCQAFGNKNITEIIALPTVAPVTSINTNSGMFEVAETGVLKYPKGSDYSAWIALLPEGWTTEEF